MFSEDDVKFLQGYATILSFAIDQARLVDLNAALAAEKDMLLRELGHRVRNNNQQLMSLINLQLGGVTNVEVRDNLEKVAQRIRALTSVNQQLESSGRAHLVDLGQYLLAITGSLYNFHGEAAAEVKLETEIAQVEIATERAQAIGLIVNEFLTNSFKYAFRDRRRRAVGGAPPPGRRRHPRARRRWPGHAERPGSGPRPQADRPAVPSDRRRGELGHRRRHPPHAPAADQGRLTALAARAPGTQSAAQNSPPPIAVIASAPA